MSKKPYSPWGYEIDRQDMKEQIELFKSREYRPMYEDKEIYHMELILVLLKEIDRILEENSGWAKGSIKTIRDLKQVRHALQRVWKFRGFSTDESIGEYVTEIAKIIDSPEMPHLGAQACRLLCDLVGEPVEEVPLTVIQENATLREENARLLVELELLKKPKEAEEPDLESLEMDVLLHGAQITNLQIEVAQLKQQLEAMRNVAIGILTGDKE